MNLFIKIDAWYRLFVWGYCPECNADSPKYFECDVCDKWHLNNRYGKPTSEMKKVWWGKYIKKHGNN